jgi:hypothetical protein
MGLVDPHFQEVSRLRGEAALARQQASTAGMIATALLRGERPSKELMENFATCWRPFREGLRAQAIAGADRRVEAHRHRHDRIRKLGGEVPQALEDELTKAMGERHRICMADPLTTGLY